MHPIFPHFAKLTLEDKDEYNKLVEQYTPFSDLSFTTLHIWWNLDDKLSFSVLNDNLVLNYSQPFNKKDSGLCLIGKSRVDDSIKTLFEYLREHGQPVRLVHVPESVVENIADKTLCVAEEEPHMHEYVMEAAKLAGLDSSELARIRRKVNRFLREVEDKKLEVLSLDLSQDGSKRLILDSIADWQERFPRGNDPRDTESNAIESTLSNCEKLGMENLCLFIDSRLQAVALFHCSQDGNYLILNHLKADYQTPFIFDFMTQQVAKKALGSNIKYLNMEMDLGIEGLKNHKMGLRPVGFLKKYALKQTN